jgi:hypothetical protein
MTEESVFSVWQEQEIFSSALSRLALGLTHSISGHEALSLNTLARAWILHLPPPKYLIQTGTTSSSPNSSCIEEDSTYSFVLTCKYFHTMVSDYRRIWIDICVNGPPLWSSGHSTWLQIRRPGFDSRHYKEKHSGSGTGSTQPREYNWGATW